MGGAEDFFGGIRAGEMQWAGAGGDWEAGHGVAAPPGVAALPGDGPTGFIYEEDLASQRSMVAASSANFTGLER